MSSNPKPLYTVISLTLILMTGILIYGLRQAALKKTAHRPSTAILKTFDSDQTGGSLDIIPQEHMQFVIHRQGDADGYILRIPIHGLIIAQSDDVPMLPGLQTSQLTVATQVERLLDYAATQENIKGVLLDIDSPGGTVSGASQISEALESFRATSKKQVLAHVTGLAASGGYWVAASADRIVARQGTMVGSVGVILGPFKYYRTVTSEGGLFDSVVTKDGIETYTVTAGKYKDTFSPYRKITDAELAHYQDMVNAHYDDFVTHIAIAREIDPTYIKDTIKALIYDEKTARKEALIDDVGTLDEALADMGWSQFSVVGQTYTFGLLDSLFGLGAQALVSGKTSPATPPRVCSMCKQPLAFYGDLAELY